MTRIHRFILAALLTAGAGGAAAQDTPSPLRLSLDEALDRAAARNASVLLARADLDEARAGRMRTNAAFLPSLSLSETGVTTNDPLNAFGFKLKQETVGQQDFAPDLLNDPDRISNFTTAVEIRQPVFNPDGLYRRKAAGYQVRAAGEALDRTQAAVDLQVKRAYFLVETARRRVSVVDSALASARRNRDRIRDLHEQGLVDRADLLGGDVRVLELESDLEQASADARSAADRLSWLLGIDEPVEFDLTTPLTRLSIDVTALDPAASVRTRSDVRALALRADAARTELRSRKSTFLPRLNVFGGYELNDETAFGANGESWQAGFSLSWKLFAGLDQAGAVRQAAASLNRAEIAVRDAQMQAAVELRSELRNLEAARKRLDQTTRAVEQAREAFRIRSDRFEQGLVQAPDLLQAEVALARQRLALLNALYEHNLIIHRLEYLTERPLID
jgi:outer membrane protein TolC